MLAFSADGGDIAVPRVNDDLFGKHDQLVANRSDDLRIRTAPQVGASDAALEKRVAGDEAGRGGGVSRFDLGGGARASFVRGRGRVVDYQTDTARRVTGSMEDARGETSPAHRVAVFDEILNPHGFGSRNAEPLSLNVEVAVQLEIALVNQDRCSGRVMKASEAAHVVDVGVRAEDRADVELVLLDDGQDAINFVARVNDDGLAGMRVAQD